MAINFPDSPSVDDTHTVGDKVWAWNGTYWHLSGNSSTFYAQDTTPSAPTLGDFWFESDTGGMFIYYDSTWVEIGHATDFGSSMSDADGDTLIQLEEGTDDDHIRFDTAGTERMKIDNNGTVHITNDLTVNGTTTTINSTTLTVDDKNIELGSVATPSDTTADGGGITLKGATDKTILWENDTNTWDFNQGITVAGNIKTSNALICEGTNATAIRLTQTDVDGAYISITETDGSTRMGYMGFPSNDDLHLKNETSGGHVYLSTNNATRLTVTNAGNVGIGDATPAQKLSVAGTASFTDSIQTGQETFTQEPWSGSTIALGNYGSVGTQGSYASTLAWNWERGTDSGYYHLNVNSLPQAGYFAIESGGHRWGFNDSYSPVGWPTERMRLTQTGLGIGTTSPVAPLHVYGSANSGTYEGSGTSNTTAYIKGSGDYPTALTLDADGSSDDVARVRILNAGANKWQINYGDDIIWSYATWTERMRVSSAGILSIHAGAGEWAKIYGGGSAGDGAWAQYFDSASNHMGYVGFPGNEDLHLQANCANPASQIFIRTAVGYCAYFNADGYFKPYTNNVFRCGVAGMVWNEVHTTDVYTHDGGVHTSDVLEKTDVIDTPLGVDFIKELRPVQYRWIDGTRSHQGFIAQDVETVLNGTAGTTASDQGMWCVVEVDTTDDINEDVLDDDGNVVGVERTTVPGEQFERQSLRYNELMAPMVKALQEIVTRLEVLESA